MHRQLVEDPGRGLRHASREGLRPYAKYNSTHYFKVSGFNRFDPDAALLPRVAAFASRNPSYRTLASDLEKLGRPDTGRAEWSVVLDNLGTGQRLMKNEIASAQRARRHRLRQG